VKNHICKVSNASISIFDNEIVFEISANRFLRNMVRAIVGTLVEVGLNKLSLEDFKNIIASKNRQKAAASAPAEGLYLWDVVYPIALN
jgi:tRNA pseudouridine38-40 synthase